MLVLYFWNFLCLYMLFYSFLCFLCFLVLFLHLKSSRKKKLDRVEIVSRTSIYILLRSKQRVSFVRIKFLQETFYPGVSFLRANFWRIDFPLENVLSLFRMHYSRVWDMVWHASMGDEVAWLVWLGWVVCLRGWCASVDKVGSVLAWLAH